MLIVILFFLKKGLKMGDFARVTIDKDPFREDVCSWTIVL
jgi:hypothetical protein